MKKILLYSIFLLIILTLSGIYRSSLLFSIYPDNQQSFLLVSSNVSSVINSIIGLSIYALIFYLSYNVAKMTKFSIIRNTYLKVVSGALLIILLIELSKIILIHISLREIIPSLVPDDTIAIQLGETEYMWLINATNIVFLIILPVYLFLSFKENGVSTKSSLLNSAFVFLGFLFINML